MRNCDWCEEPIEAGAVLEHMHVECAIRGVVGSVAHLEKRCGCFVRGSDESDPPGLTKRQAALAARELFAQQHAQEIFENLTSEVRQ